MPLRSPPDCGYAVGDQESGATVPCCNQYPWFRLDQGSQTKNSYPNEHRVGTRADQHNRQDMFAADTLTQNESVLRTDSHDQSNA